MSNVTGEIMKNKEMYNSLVVHTPKLIVEVPLHFTTAHNSLERLLSRVVRSQYFPETAAILLMLYVGLLHQFSPGLPMNYRGGLPVLSNAPEVPYFFHLLIIFFTVFCGLSNVFKSFCHPLLTDIFQ